MKCLGISVSMPPGEIVLVLAPAPAAEQRGSPLCATVNPLPRTVTLRHLVIETNLLNIEKHGAAGKD
jgi:hypothetical protein